MTAPSFVAPDLRRLDETSAEVVCCGIWRDVRPFAGVAGLVDFRLAGRLSKLARDGFLIGELGEALVLPTRPRLPMDKLVVLGLGQRAAFTEATFTQVLGRARDTLAGLHVKRAVLELPGRADEAIAADRAMEILLGLPEDERSIALVESVEAVRRIEDYVQQNPRALRRPSRAPSSDS